MKLSDETFHNFANYVHVLGVVLANVLHKIAPNRENTVMYKMQIIAAVAVPAGKRFGSRPQIRHQELRWTVTIMPAKKQSHRHLSVLLSSRVRAGVTLFTQSFAIESHWIRAVAVCLLRSHKTKFRPGLNTILNPCRLFRITYETLFHSCSLRKLPLASSRFELT